MLLLSFPTVVKILFFMAVLVVLLFAVLRWFRLPEVECEICEWAGPEDDLDTYTTAEHSEDYHDDFRKNEMWFSFCPNCGSSKLIYKPSKPPIRVTPS